MPVGAKVADGMSERRAVMRLGVVLERRRIDHPWQRERWQAVAVIPWAPDTDEARLLLHDEVAGVARWHVATLPLEIHRTDTEAYKYNLSGRQPQVYVVLRPGKRPGFLWWPALLTVSPYEAEAYAGGHEDQVDAVPMPEPVIAWLKAFIDRHHIDRPFYKRRRKGHDQGMDAPSEFVPVGQEWGDDDTRS